MKISDVATFDPELETAVEAGKARVRQILKAIRMKRSLNDKVVALKGKLMEFRTTSNGMDIQSDGVKSEELNITGGKDNRKLKIRVYKPESDNDNLPCIYHIHGGGMIVGSIEEDIAQMSVISKIFHTAVVDVDYRLAPEFPYPTGMEDCYDGLVWVSHHAKDLHIDPSRIGLLGESAGGGLAAAITIKARDNGGPKVLFNALLAPMLDDRNSTPSSRLCKGAWPSWPRELNILAWYALLGDNAGSRNVPPYASPAHARDLRGLPPTYIEVGELEVFRDEDIIYANRLMNSGVPVELHVYPGTFHSSYNVAPKAAISKRTVKNRMDWISTQICRRF